mmetsp:Transcript_15763/g.27217  ORF Transcript_15763/g.27217 Transcript_15763/m.27217 type:complete len:220 (-) Transcript_15763:360-1019(-)
MRRIFGAAKTKEPAPTIDESADRLQGRSDKVDEQIIKIEQQLTVLKDQIKKTRPGPSQEGYKRRAIQLLKQKRMYEGQRDQLSAQNFNIQQTQFTVSNIKDTVGTVQALTGASKEMKRMFKENKELDLNRIDALQDSMSDMMDLSREINEAMGRSYDVPDDIDESDLMAELDALEEDMGNEEAVKGAVPSYMQEPEMDMPAAPSAQAYQHPADANALQA